MKNQNAPGFSARRMTGESNLPGVASPFRKSDSLSQMNQSTIAEKNSHAQIGNARFPDQRANECPHMSADLTRMQKGPPPVKGAGIPRPAQRTLISIRPLEGELTPSSDSPAGIPTSHSKRR